MQVGLVSYSIDGPDNNPVFDINCDVTKMKSWISEIRVCYFFYFPFFHEYLNLYSAVSYAVIRIRMWAD